MGLAIYQHTKHSLKGRSRRIGMIGSGFASALATFIFVGQIVTKWNEGGWVVLIVFSFLILMAHIILISPAGYRDPKDIHRVIREKSRIQGAMGNIVEWQSLRIQEYRYLLMMKVAEFFGIFGIFKPLRFEDEPVPVEAGPFEKAMNHAEHKTFLEEYLKRPEPRVGGIPKESTPEETDNP
jgi:hypothetical protein